MNFSIGDKVHIATGSNPCTVLGVKPEYWDSNFNLIEAEISHVFPNNSTVFVVMTNNIMYAEKINEEIIKTYKFDVKYLNMYYIHIHTNFIKKIEKKEIMQTKQDPYKTAIACIECKEFYPYAVPNYGDKLVCWTCCDSNKWKYTRIDKQTVACLLK